MLEHSNVRGSGEEVGRDDEGAAHGLRATELLVEEDGRLCK